MTNTAPGLLVRDPQTILSLPPGLRWEVTRRHPSYVMSWEKAAQPDEQLSPIAGLVRDATRAALHAIQVSEIYPDPALEATEAGFSDIDTVWQDGAIAPLQVNSILGALHMLLPPESRRLCAEFFHRSAGIPSQITDLPDEQKAGAAEAGFNLLKDLKATEELAVLLPGLMFSVNIHAPQRAVVDAVKGLHTQLRSDLNITEQRRRWDKLSDYLEVWDRREGWEAGTYDARKETLLREISQDLGVPVSTALNHYKKAFEHIFGHKYTPELWSTYMFVPKYGGFLESEPCIRRTRRDRQSRTRRDVPSSSLGQAGTTDFVAASTHATDNTFESDLVSDLIALINLGRADGEIAQELDCTETEAAHARAVLQARAEEGL